MLLLTATLVAFTRTIFVCALLIVLIISARPADLRFFLWLRLRRLDEDHFLETERAA